MAYAFTGTWQAAAKLAGQSSGREVRDVLPLGPLIVPGPFAFCNLMGTRGKGDDGKMKDALPAIKTREVSAEAPELWDWEVQPDQFYLLTGDTGHAVLGTSVDWVLDKVSGIAVSEVLHKVDQGIQIRVTAIDSGTNTVTGTVIVNTSGDDTATTDSTVARVEKLPSAHVDGATVGDGVNREATKRWNYGQFMISSLAVGILRDKFKHYGEGDGQGSYFREEKERMLTDLYRMMEAVMIAGQRYEEGSGSSRRTYMGGMEWWAGNPIYNNAPGGLCSEDAFLDFLEDAMEAGGGDKLYFLCDAAFKRMVTSFQRSKKRVTDNSNKYVTNVDEWETPVGTVVLVGSQFLNKPARRGSAISFFPKNLTATPLRGLDLTWMGDLNIPNVLTTKGAYMKWFSLMANNPASISTWGNFLG